MTEARNQRQFSVFSALALASLFSGALYRDVARNWRGIGLRLLVLVLLIAWVADGIRMDRAVKHFASDEFPSVVETFPPITIKDGVVSSPVDQPYYMKDKQTGKTFAVLDTTGTITSLDQADNAMLLLTENKLHYRDSSNPGQVKIQDLSQIKNFYVDRPIVTGWVTWGSKWMAWVLIPIAFVFSLIYRLVQGLIYAAVGMIWNGTFNAQLSYAALMRLAFVAVTPVILLDTALSFTKIQVPSWSLICLVIAMVGVALGVKANQKAPSPPTFGYGAPFPPLQQPQQPYPYSQPPGPQAPAQPLPPVPQYPPSSGPPPVGL